MNKVELSNKDFRSMPYSGTEVRWTKTRGEIDGLLYDLQEQGVLKRKAWLTEGDEEMLYVELEIDLPGGLRKTIQLKFQPVMVYVKKKVGRSNKARIVLERDTSWRLFWWHLKTKLEAVRFGLVTFETEFMSNIVYQLPEGGEVTMGEALKGILAEDRLGRLALEQKKDERKPIEVEYKVES